MTTTQPSDTDVLDTEPVDTTPDLAPQAPVAPGRELKPLLASWLKDRGEFTEKVTDVSRRTAHTTTWHALHSPLHILRILRYAPRGLWRVIHLIWGWVMDAEGKPLRREAVNANQAKEYLHLAREREHRIHRRWIGLTATSVVVLTGLVVAWFMLPSWQVASWFTLTPGWVFALFGAAVVAGLGYVGRPVDKPLIRRATDITGNPTLRPELILKALVSLGIPKMTEPEDIRILTDLTREGSVGSSVELELTEGVTAGEVLEKRGKLSAGLRRPIGTVWPSVGKRHEAHLILYVSDEPMATARQKPWPLLKQGSVDVFKPAPVFTDQRGKWVELTLAYTCGVIGAVPRVGKTFALRELLLVGALDPRCVLYTYDLKGTGDLSALKLVAHRYGVGDEPEDVDQQLNEMRDLRQELRRRVKVIRELPDTECPENKVTSELASRRDLKLEPILVGVDECQCWFEHEDKAIRTEFIAICTDLVKRGPAVGIMCYFATQKPDAGSIPTAIADNAIIRFCLMVHGWRSNDQVLGTGAHERGIRATMLAFEDKGIGYFKGEGPDTQLVRTVVGLDAVASGKVALRARAARERDGRITGYAAGEAMEREVEEVILLDDVRQVVGTADTMHLTDLVAGLAALRPGAWGSLDSASLASQLRTAGVTVASVHVSGKPRYKASGKGVKREWLDVDTTLQVGNTDPEGGNVRQLRP
jgi:DNA segregation ATPase FtsK/SpoIIIE, S-DNA-T family